MKQLKITKFPALDYAGNEAFNTLSTNLSFAGASVKKIMITSCHAAEGKSYLSMNLMRTLAQRGIKVALVDADLRRSMVNSDYGLKYEDGRSDGKGLSHFLAGMVGMDEVIYQTDIPNAIMVRRAERAERDRSECAGKPDHHCAGPDRCRADDRRQVRPARHAADPCTGSGGLRL